MEVQYVRFLFFYSPVQQPWETRADGGEQESRPDGGPGNGYAQALGFISLMAAFHAEIRLVHQPGALDVPL